MMSETLSTTQLHFITGKGGVGKSTLAASLVKKLSDRNEGPVLLIDMQGNGHALSLLGMEDRTNFEIKFIRDMNHVWACRIMPKSSFRQYFSLLLSMGQHDSTFAQLTSGLRGKFVDTILDNKVVSAFVDVCPGLEPAALLGKVHYECTEGLVPESDHRWKHVVVDAPSTGHCLMLFKSTQSLIDVFGSGIVFKQAKGIMDYMTNPKLSNFYIVATPEELPLKEAQDLAKGLETLNIPAPLYTINRLKPKAENSAPIESLEDLEWKRIVEIEVERSELESELIHSFESDVSKDRILNYLPEVPHSQELLSQLSEMVKLHSESDFKR